MLPAEVLPKGLVPGTPFGRYVIEGVLGAGGMARVYRARDTALGRAVALKVLHQPGDVASDTPSMGGKERIQREARALAALEHPAGFAHRDHPFRAIVTGRSGPS
jgi:serine/threonine-protein kinase